MTPAHLNLPLRGLASTDIAPALEAWLVGLPGVLAVELRTTEFVVHVSYDASRVAPPAIRDRLHAFAGNGPRATTDPPPVE